MRISDYLRKRIYERTGIVDCKAGNATYEELVSSEWSLEFERLMRARLIMGAIRYGRLRDPDKPSYDCIGAIIERARAYAENGNREHLVDIANLALIEFEEGMHPKGHFAASDDSYHVEGI
ncbi:MAG: hypothetical protein ABFD98_15720 [Syntrophobacteraceae bacterium]|nr:hypothetical protein [Desulfobacteraceae bacterium]